jgi:cation diffusion facilitator family transporter
MCVPPFETRLQAGRLWFASASDSTEGLSASRRATVPQRHNVRMQVGSYLKISIAVALATIVLKFGAWWLTDSVGLLSDALESVVNLAGAVFALMMVTVAAQPPDEDHPYGHHKAEYFSSGFEGVLILIAALAIIWAAAQRFVTPQPLQSLGLGLTLSVISSAMNGALAWAMLRKAREHRSMALEGDARHLFTDVWTSVGVVGALVAVHFTGWLWLDPAIAILVAGNIAREGVMLVWASADGLMDRALEPDVREQIGSTLREFEHQAIRFDHIVTRRAGQRRFVDLHMHMPAGWTLGRAAALRTSVEQALMSAVPGLRATIQLLPMDVESHFSDAEDLK